jgi:hypothetical protein
MSFEGTFRRGRPHFDLPNARNQRGGFLGVDADDLSMTLTPFKVRGDDTQSITLKPVLTSGMVRITGAPFDPLVALEDGRKISFDSPEIVGFCDGSPILQAVFEIPISQVIDRGDGKAVLKTMEVIGDCELWLQPTHEPEELGGAPLPIDIQNSIAIYSKLQNNINYPDGTFTHAMTGKKGQLRTPEFIFLDQGKNEISRVFGAWEIRPDNDKRFIDKVLTLADIPLGTVTIKTAATIGYTSQGSSSTGNPAFTYANRYAVDQGYKVVSAHLWSRVNSEQWAGIYEDDGNVTPRPVALVSGSSIKMPTGQSGGFTEAIHPVQPSISSGFIWLCFTQLSNLNMLQDANPTWYAGSNANGQGYANVNANGGFPDPFGTVTSGPSTAFGRQYSMYITVEAGGGGSIIPQIAHHRKKMRQ